MSVSKVDQLVVPSDLTDTELVRRFFNELLILLKEQEEQIKAIQEALP